MERSELRRLARVGAEARLEALQREIASIHQAFPDLRQRRSTAAPSPYTGGVRKASEGAVTRRRPKMSPQARKRIAEAQRKRWAEWRAKNAKSVAERRPHSQRETASPKETIRRALEAARGVKKDAAEQMGISQRALSYYLAKYRID